MANEQKSLVKHKFDEKIEYRLADIVINQEFRVAQNNQKVEKDDFEAYIDLFDAVRSEKDYDWMSDIFLPEFPAHMLTQSSMDVSQYFQTRDFVEVYVQDAGQTAKASADAAKELINRTLNRKNLYHYLKYVRAKNINTIAGVVYMHCWWEQQLEWETVGYEISQDDWGFEYEDIDRPIENYRIIKDQFNYDIVDIRNVFTDDSYAYSLQEKEWVSMLFPTNLYKLRQQQDTHGYFNLDALEELQKTPQPESKKNVEDPDKPNQPYKNSVSNDLDKLVRYGKFWYLNGKPGIDEEGEPLKGATQEECVITHVLSGNSRVLIGFHKQPYVDANGQPFRPIIRGLCYVHPTKDSGVGDGKYGQELQVAMNDTFNISNDRVRLATMPTMKGKKYVLEDTDSVYIEPMHVIELDNPADDLQEMKFSDDIAGAMNQLAILRDMQQTVHSIFPGTMGNLPVRASTTATAVAGADQRANQRGNYKMMTFDNTAMADLYWMIQQMTYQHAKPETGQKLMGDKLFSFNPALDYFYKPLSQSVESEQGKRMKIQQLDSILQKVIAVQHPKAVIMFNMLMGKILDLMGDEYSYYAQFLLDERMPLQTENQGSQPATGPAGPVSNEYMIPQTTDEMGARQTASAGQMGY